MVDNVPIREHSTLTKTWRCPKDYGVETTFPVLNCDSVIKTRSFVILHLVVERILHHATSTIRPSILRSLTLAKPPKRFLELTAGCQGASKI